MLRIILVLASVVIGNELNMRANCPGLASSLSGDFEEVASTVYEKYQLDYQDKDTVLVHKVDGLWVPVKMDSFCKNVPGTEHALSLVDGIDNLGSDYSTDKKTHDGKDVNDITWAVLSNTVVLVDPTGARVDMLSKSANRSISREEFSAGWYKPYANSEVRYYALSSVAAGADLPPNIENRTTGGLGPAWLPVSNRGLGIHYVSGDVEFSYPSFIHYQNFTAMASYGIKSGLGAGLEVYHVLPNFWTNNEVFVGNAFSVQYFEKGFSARAMATLESVSSGFSAEAGFHAGSGGYGVSMGIRWSVLTYKSEL